MLVTAVRAVVVILLGFLFAYLYGFIEHGFIPPAEHLRPRFFNHFANYPYHNVRPVLSRPSSGPSLPTESGGGVSQFWPVDLRTIRRRSSLVPFRRNLADTAGLDLVGRGISYWRTLGAEMVHGKFNSGESVFRPSSSAGAFKVANVARDILPSFS
jgi:hypothetical protein